MTDLVRLMFDDGATRPVKQSEPANAFAVFKWRGKTWAAYVITDPNYEGRCWHLDGRSQDPANNNSLQGFLTDPEGYISRHTANRHEDVLGWNQGVRGFVGSKERLALRFEVIE